MPTEHVVQQGECLSSIAQSYGFPDFRTIYDDPANADFKKRRPNPNLIYPGDVLVIPGPSAPTFTLATGQSHPFVVKRPKATLCLQAEIMTSHHYRLVVGDKTFTGQTDGSAPIEHPIPPDAATGRIELWPATQGNEKAQAGLLGWDLQLGALDPIDELSGVQARLANLGYYNGPVDGEENDDLPLAVARFQADEGLTASGDLDDDTRDALRQRHDGA